MSDQLNGVVNGYYVCNTERDVELSNRIAARNMPSRPLQPQFSMRPVSTKYALLPIIDRRAPASIPIHKEPTYNVETVFNPGDAQAPWSGFSAKINDESTLRNQFFALQNCPHTQYIPSTNSDMYKVHVSGKPVQQTHPNLFKTEQFDNFNPNTCNTGYNLFNNCTRQQLKN